MRTLEQSVALRQKLDQQVDDSIGFVEFGPSTVQIDGHFTLEHLEIIVKLMKESP